MFMYGYRITTVKGYDGVISFAVKIQFTKLSHRGIKEG